MPHILETLSMCDNRMCTAVSDYVVYGIVVVVTYVVDILLVLPGVVWFVRWCVMLPSVSVVCIVPMNDHVHVCVCVCCVVCDCNACMWG